MLVYQRVSHGTSHGVIIAQGTNSCAQNKIIARKAPEQR